MQKNAFPFFGFFAALLLTACAQPPETVAPAPVSEAQYFGFTCEQLAAEQVRLDYILAVLYSEQSQSRTDDVVSYIFLLRPAASMSGGDLRYLIAYRKGQQVAIGRAMARQCYGIRS